jgi:hypothetical protein
MVASQLVRDSHVIEDHTWIVAMVSDLLLAINLGGKNIHV